MEAAAEPEADQQAGKQAEAATDATAAPGPSSEEQQQEEEKGSDDAPMPLPYVVAADGKIEPLPGVESIFLRGNTIESLGLNALGSKQPGGTLSILVPKEKLLADIQFQGAISDWHPIKARLVASDVAEVLVRVNEDDIYRDGNNFEVAVTQEAISVFDSIAAESARRAAAAAEAAERAAAEKVLPRAKRRRAPQEWQSLGSEVEIEASAAHQTRDKIIITLQRPRREYGRATALTDSSAAEMWNGSQMECRPFRDANYDARRMEMDCGVQAVPVLREIGIQATGGRPTPGSTQYVPRDLTAADKQRIIKSKGFNDFLEHIRPRYEEALLQNAVTDVFADDFARLADEDAGGGGASKRAGLAEAQTFTDLEFSKGKVVSCVQWLPHRRGAIAVACHEPLSHTERIGRMGRLTNAYILIWNFKDPIHPEYVLESPHEVMCFQYNPGNPEVVAAGCYNGQVVIWDTSSEGERLLSRAATGQRGEEGGDEAAVPVVRHKWMSSVEYSHHTAVADLQWLPGIEIDRGGRVARMRDGSSAITKAGSFGQHLSRNASFAPGMQGAASAGDCCFFATTAPDGKVMFWDMRVDRLLKKGRKADESLDLIWKATHIVPLINLQGMDFGGNRLCFDVASIEGGGFLAASVDGELLEGCFIRPEGDENPDYVRRCHAPHAGPVVALCRSPFDAELVLSVGDWGFQLWQEGHETPVLVSPYAEECYTAACWSPTRPSVIFLADAGGTLHIWDFLDRSHEPALRFSAASTPILSLTFHPASMSSASGTNSGTRSSMVDARGSMAGGVRGSAVGAGLLGADVGGERNGGERNARSSIANAALLALGDGMGVLRIIELPRNIARPLQQERRLFSGFVSREAGRVADVAARGPARAKAKKDQEEAKKAREEANGASLGDTGIAGGATLSGAAAVAAKPRVSAAGSDKAGLAARRRSNGSGGNMVPMSAAAMAALEKGEVEYRKLEHDFKVQLGLVVEAS